MELFFDIAAIFCQILLLYTLFVCGGIGTKVALYRFFSPFGFLCLFYGLFFIVEQFYYEANNFNFVGQDTFPIAVSRSVYNETQIYLILFLFCAWIGSLPTMLYLKGLKVAEVKAILTARFSWIERALLYFFFAIGMVAIAYLGRRLLDINENGGYRGLLVKSSDGLIATTLSFFANFAFSVLLASFVERKRYVLAVGITLLFAVGILYTGSRARLLWPLVITFIIILSAKNKVPMLRMMLIAAVLLVVLLVMDPLKKALTTGGDFSFADLETAFSRIMVTRNFDGFTIFSQISATHIIRPDIHYLFRGIRDVLMATFFPQLYDLGVAMGSTIPGYLFLSGGLIGFALLSMLYGLLLGLLNVIFRKLRNRWLIFSYFFGMTWICAVGGDAVESLDKLIVAIAPGPVIIAITMIADANRKWPILRSGRRGHRADGKVEFPVLTGALKK